jgi:hypothetical protein
MQPALSIFKSLRIARAKEEAGSRWHPRAFTQARAV